MNFKGDSYHEALSHRLRRLRDKRQTLGYLNGKHAAVARFADTCDALNMVVVEDRQSGENRHFYCVAISTKDAVGLPARRALPPQQKGVLFEQRINRA